MARSGNLLPPFKPGQSGNPKGGSKKASARRFLRQAVQDALNGDPPPEVVERLRELGFTELDIKGARYADVIAARLIGLAATGNARQLLDAITRITATEPQQIEHSGAIERAAPVLEQDDAALDEVADILQDADALH